jgi:hypothetical protein
MCRRRDRYYLDPRPGPDLVALMALIRLTPTIATFTKRVGDSTNTWETAAT